MPIMSSPVIVIMIKVEGNRGWQAPSDHRTCCRGKQQMT